MPDADDVHARTSERPAAGTHRADPDDRVVTRQPRPSTSDGSDADGELRDAELQQEIELVADLVLAASASDDPLSLDQIDQLLGLS